MSQTVEHLDHVHVSFLAPPATVHLTSVLARVDGLMRVETNRSRLVALQGIRTELSSVIAHLESESGAA